MTANETLILYTRPGCHLCEQVVGLLENLGFDWREVNIEDNPDLEKRYGLLIPVIYSNSTKKELHFPFGEAQLVSFQEE